MSRYFGVKDLDLIRNLNISFLILLILAFLTDYLITIFVLSFYNNFFYLGEYLVKIYGAVFLMYIFIILLLFSVQCKFFMKRLSKL